MSYVCLLQKRVKARKGHRCVWCGESIPRLTEYIRENSIYDGRYQNHKWHPECLDALHDSGDEEFCPGDNERPSPERQ